VLLGDVKHDFGKIARQEWKEVLELFDFFKRKNCNIIIIKGNHDKIIDIKVFDKYVLENVCFMHGDVDFKESYDKKIKFWVVGHGHPAVKISDGVKIEKYKCFLVGKYKGKKVIVVPSFFEGNAGSDPREDELGLAWNFKIDIFDVKIVGDNLEVLDFGKLKNL